VQTPDPDLPDGQVWHEPTRSDSPQAEDAIAVVSSTTPATTPVTVRAKSGRWIKIALAGLGVIAVVEGAVIAGLFNTLLGTAQAPVVIAPPQPVADLTSAAGTTGAAAPTGAEATGTPATGAPNPDPAAVVSPPAQTPAAASSAVVPPVSAPPATQTQPAPVTTAGTAALPPIDPAAPPAPPRVGTLQVTSRIELQIFEKGQLIGTSGSAITLPRGTHQLEFVNETLGFRATQTVNMRLATTPVNVAVPNGRISINAVPWAEVWIDGNPAGQTPLANLAIPIGQHEIVFRHPQLGEQRQTAVVKVEGLTRVSATLQGSR
jgi:hypothetical protein